MLIQFYSSCIYFPYIHKYRMFSCQVLLLNFLALVDDPIFDIFEIFPKKDSFCKMVIFNFLLELNPVMGQVSRYKMTNVTDKMSILSSRHSYHSLVHFTCFLIQTFSDAFPRNLMSLGKHKFYNNCSPQRVEIAGSLKMFRIGF